MPFDVIEAADSLTSLITFRVSTVYELLLSIRTLFKPGRWHEEFSKRAKDSLDPALLEELEALYVPFNDGAYYFELPVDYDRDDIPSFFDYIRRMKDADFLFYALGRMFSREELAELLRARKPADAIRAALVKFGDKYQWYAVSLDAILADISGFKMRFIKALSAYWETFFKYEITALEPIWAMGLQEKRMILEREGGRGLLEKVTGRAELPPEMPEGMPYREIVFTACAFLPARVYQFFGYGSITILFDPKFTEEHRLATQNARDEAASVLRALDDETRLKILQMVAQHGHRMHGKAIAERLDISASAVSRHLALLKEGGLISEEPQKNLITYRFHREVVTGLAEKILDYLYS